MVMPQELYEKTKLPLDGKFFDALIAKYMSIPFCEVNIPAFAADMRRLDGNPIMSTCLYEQINTVTKSVKESSTLEEERKKFISKVQQDFLNAGAPFDPKLHGGLTNPIRQIPGWYVFKSWTLLGTKKIHSADTMHRFYIGVLNHEKYGFASELYDAFQKKGIPFHFKIGIKSEERPDQIVIYTSTPLLKATMEVINVVSKKRPDFIANCHEPSIIVGKADDKIGYASERPDAKSSYTQIICNSFTYAIENAIDKYMRVPIVPAIKSIYDQQIAQLQNEGISIEMEGKKFIAAKTLLQFDGQFKKDVFSVFQAELAKWNIDFHNICFHHEAKKQLEAMYPSLDHKDNSTVLTQADGTQLTREDYLKKYNVSSWIPAKSKVTLKDGSVMSGNEFISYMFDVAPFYNSFQELMLHQVEMVDRNANYTSTLASQRQMIENQMNAEAKRNLQQERELIEQQFTEGLVDIISGKSDEEFPNMHM